jgi:hypothetical protein
LFGQLPALAGVAEQAVKFLGCFLRSRAHPENAMLLQVQGSFGYSDRARKPYKNQVYFNGLAISGSDFSPFFTPWHGSCNDACTKSPCHYFRASPTKNCSGRSVTGLPSDAILY